MVVEFHEVVAGSEELPFVRGFLDSTQPDVFALAGADLPEPPDWAFPGNDEDEQQQHVEQAAQGCLNSTNHTTTNAPETPTPARHNHLRITADGRTRSGQRRPMRQQLQSRGTCVTA